MKIYTQELTVKTKRRRELINITSTIEEHIRKSNIRNGITLIFLPHATAALISNEDEPLIRKDYMETFEKLAPEKYSYEHNKIDNNADSHILSMIFKQYHIYPIIDGEIKRGTWQELMLAEFDGPRTRKIVIVAIGE